jgi:hypothetical protein
MYIAFKKFHTNFHPYLGKYRLITLIIILCLIILNILEIVKVLPLAVWSFSDNEVIKEKIIKSLKTL